MPVVVGDDSGLETEVVLEGSATADPGQDLFVANRNGPDIRLKYDGRSSSISANELISHWSKDTIYLGYGGQAPGQPRYSLVLFVQPTWRGNWLIHYQLSRQARRAAVAAAR